MITSGASEESSVGEVEWIGGVLQRLADDLDEQLEVERWVAAFGTGAWSLVSRENVDTSQVEACLDGAGVSECVLILAHLAGWSPPAWDGRRLRTQRDPRAPTPRLL